MKRLTERDEYGNADIIALSDVMPEIYASLSFSETNALTEAINRLANYEDSGVLPDKLAEKRKKGRWIDMNDHVMCSCCGTTHYGADKNYCPHCGAKMESEEIE